MRFTNFLADNMQIHIRTGGQQQGPFTIEQINQTLEKGALSADSTLACYDGCADWIPLKDVPGVKILSTHSYASSPPSPPPLAQPPAQGDATGGVIPYKNVHALTAYYLGIFGLIPIIGVLLAIPAVSLGISGLKKHKANPIIKGSIHAWIGIILGAISIGYNTPLIFNLFLRSR